MTDDAKTVCSLCGVERTPDIPDYSPIQPIMGQPLGWYFGKDGEICPKDIAELMTSANRGFTYRYYGQED